MKKNFEPPKEIITASALPNGVIIRGGWEEKLGTLPLVSGSLADIDRFLSAEAINAGTDEEPVYFVGCVEDAQDMMNQKDMYWLIQSWLYRVKRGGKYSALQFHIIEAGNKAVRTEIARRLNNLYH